jgi:leucine dehydrogenase
MEYLVPLEHEELVIRRGRRSGLYTMVGVHSTARGPALGGCRMWSYADARLAIRDVMRLSRAMTYKAAVTDLPLGGGKGVIMLRAGDPPSPEQRHDALLDFGDLVASLGGRYITAEDVGTSAEDMAVIAERTEHVTGLDPARGGSGDPSPYTALGVVTAIKLCCQRVFGADALAERTIGVLGLGHVGGRVARRLAEEGARLVVADIDPAKRALADELGAAWEQPDALPFRELDVLSPCALGELLDHETVPRLRCRIVAGAANNQLADDSVAELLQRRGILWAPDFVANAGGLINVEVELEGYDPEKARQRLRRISDTLQQVFDEAEATGAGPLAAAMELARRRLEEASAAVGTAPTA